MTVPYQTVCARHYCRASDPDTPNGHILQTKAAGPVGPEAEFDARNLATGGVVAQWELAGMSRIPVARVLVVDDLPAMRTLMSKTLRTLGYHPATAENAEDAMNRLSRERIDVVLSDVHMPGLSGLDLAKAAKTRWPALAIILFSAMLSEPLQGGEKTAGVDLLLAKPVRMDTLNEALKIILYRKRRACAQSRVN